VTGHPLGGAGRLQALLRVRDLPVLCGARRLAGIDDALAIHVRTLRPGDEKELIQAFADLQPSGGKVLQ
jgi:hypothetical protein